MYIMKEFLGLLEKYVDFHFVVAIVVILGTAGSLSLQFNEANTEFDMINASAYSLIKNRPSSNVSEEFLISDLELIDKELSELNF